MKYFLGIDIGTFESKGILADRQGNIVASAAKPHQMLVPQAGWAEHRPIEDWWDDFVFICRKLLADSKMDPHEIRAVGTSAIGPCMLPVDKAGKPLMNAVLYGVDTRATKEIDELTARIGAERILEYCGNALTSQSVGPKILWLKRNRPDVFAKTHKFLTSTSYLVFRLTGRFVIDHYTAANMRRSIRPSAALGAMNWHQTSFRLSGCRTSLDDGHCRCRHGEGGEGNGAGRGNAGDLRHHRCGGGSDQRRRAGAARHDDDVWLHHLHHRGHGEAREGCRLWYAPWLFPGQHASMAGLATSGTLTHWFRENLARELDPASAMRELVAEAESSPPGANGLVMLPYFSGERTPIHDTHAKGAIFGLNLTHTRGDLFRAALEGIACGTNHIIETYDAVGEPPRNVFSVGGGTKNKVWAQATSDVSGRTQILRDKSMGASYGNAFLAALAVGDAQARDIKTWNPVASEINANKEHGETYRKHYGVFRDLYERNRDLMEGIGG